MAFRDQGLCSASGSGVTQPNENQLSPVVVAQLEGAALRRGLNGPCVLGAIQSQLSVEEGEGVCPPQGAEIVRVLDAMLDTCDSTVDFSTSNDQRARLILIQKLYKLAQVSRQHPEGLIVHISREPEDESIRCHGHASDVYRGTLISDGSPVALKSLRALRVSPYHRKKRMIENLYCEAILWRTLTPNEYILPFLGIVLNNNGSHSDLFIVLPWMERENLRDHVQKLMHENTLSERDLVSRIGQWLREIACGLAHLHSAGIIHGSLRAVNIFLASNNSIRLADFGIGALEHGDGVWDYTPLSPSPAAWKAPELLGDADGTNSSIRPTAASDVYAFGSVCVELFSGTAPFSGLSEVVIMLRVLRGRRPERPKNIGDEIWKLVESCWNEDPTMRPSPYQLVERLSATWRSKLEDLSQILITFALSTLSIPYPHGDRVRRDLLKSSKNGDPSMILSLRGPDAQCALDILHEVLLGCCSGKYSLDMIARNELRRLVLKLSMASDLFPNSLFVTGVTCSDKDDYLPGGFADVHHGTYGERKVAIKRLRPPSKTSDQRDIAKLKKALYLEAITWRSLHHAHVLPFTGITRDIFPSPVCMVLPWMENGNAVEYVLRENRALSVINKLLHQIALGLHYLHDEGIIHADLRGANTLIDESGSAVLADFGLAAIDIGGSSIRPGSGGNPRWLAPEILDPQEYGIEPYESKPTRPADVYSFGCVCIELYTGAPPFGKIQDAQVAVKLARRETPGRPKRPGKEMVNELWELVSRCWKKQPGDRPSAKQLVEAEIITLQH